MNNLRDYLPNNSFTSTTSTVCLVLLAVFLMWVMFRNSFKLISLQRTIKKGVFSLNNNNDHDSILRLENKIDELLSFYEKFYGIKVGDLYSKELTEKNLISFKKDIDPWYSLKQAFEIYKKNEMILDELFLYLI